MAARNDGGQAFPRSPGEHGMSLRDYFAAMAMQAMCSGEQWPTPQDMQEIARRSYMQADLLLAVRRGA